MESNQNQYLGTAPIPHLLLKFSLPSVTSMLVSSLYNMVDQIFIGQGIGYIANGATNVVFPIVTIANAFALLIGNGCAAFQSICLGKGDNHKVKQTIGNSIVLTIVTSLLLVVLFTLFQNNFLWLFGDTEQNFEYAKQYLQIILIGFPFFYVHQYLEFDHQCQWQSRLYDVVRNFWMCDQSDLRSNCHLYFQYGCTGSRAGHHYRTNRHCTYFIALYPKTYFTV